MEELVLKFLEDKGYTSEEVDWEEVRVMTNVIGTELDNIAKENGLYEMVQALDESDRSLLKDVLTCVIDYIFMKSRNETIESAEVINITKAMEIES